MTSRHASIPETAGTALRVISCLRSIHVEREMTNMTMKPIVLSAAILVAGWYSAMPSASAQQPAPQRSAPQQSAPQQSAAPNQQSEPQLSDQKLDAAAAALEQVATIQQTFQQRFAQASTPSDQKRIVAEAHDALTKAVQDQGLSVEEYNSIIETAQNNPEVRGKVLQRIQPQGGHE
jgi:hypothetical protein